MSAQDMTGAVLAGRRAATNGRPPSACPYALDSDDPRTASLARLWLRGYDQVEPFPVDTSD
jgi:hypothetical protein